MQFTLYDYISVIKIMICGKKMIEYVRQLNKTAETKN